MQLKADCLTVRDGSGMPLIIQGPNCEKGTNFKGQIAKKGADLQGGKSKWRK